jgi:hypothetical protein
MTQATEGNPMTPDTLAWLQGHRDEAKRMIELWDANAPGSESDTPAEARKVLKIVNGLLLKLSGEQDDAAPMTSTRALRCPRCNSPDPKLHPAMQFEGEVQPCTHEWHKLQERWK